MGTLKLVCPKCHKKVDTLNALSRFSDTMICSLCGNLEALEVAYKAGMFTKEQYESECKRLKSLQKRFKF